MAPLTPDQLRNRRRVEGLISAVVPALDLLLAAGDRLSRIVDRGHDEYHPPRVTPARIDGSPPR
jgi:hypothetical protein